MKETNQNKTIRKKLKYDNQIFIRRTICADDYSTRSNQHQQTINSETKTDGIELFWWPAPLLKRLRNLVSTQWYTQLQSSVATFSCSCDFSLHFTISYQKFYSLYPIFNLEIIRNYRRIFKPLTINLFWRTILDNCFPKSLSVDNLWFSRRNFIIERNAKAVSKIFFVSTPFKNFIVYISHFSLVFNVECSLFSTSLTFWRLRWLLEFRVKRENLMFFHLTFEKEAC